MNLVEIIRFLESGNDVNAQLEAFKQLNAYVTDKDLPVLLAAIKSETSNFWVRELLSEPIINLAGSKAIPELMAALRKNFEEGHDNDGFQAYLADLAESDPKGVRAELEKLAEKANKAELEDINWLLEFCQ
jgi:hypothetical protein